MTNTYDPDNNTANQSALTLTTGEVNLAQDFGYRDTLNPNSIAGTIWRDTDADGYMDGSETGWLAGLRDPAVGRALALMHTQPGRNWTADDLANEARLSRSAFAERFTAVIGQPPMRYLTNWRMQVAAKLLKDGAPISRVAFDVGYGSEAAFTRAFRREVGLPPAAWRQQFAGG